MPNAASIAFIELGLIVLPRKRAIIAWTGDPGISRGIRKLIVSAAQSVITKNCSLFRTALIRRSDRSQHGREGPAGSERGGTLEETPA